MHALDQVARELRQPLFNNTWARELAETAHRSFTCGPRGKRRMVWKMSIDLSQPLVPSMGCAAMNEREPYEASPRTPSFVKASGLLPEVPGAL
jgi:hypothetical protein